MFFDADPKDLEPAEKEMLDAMLEVWEKDLYSEIRTRNQQSAFDSNGQLRTDFHHDEASVRDVLAAQNLRLVEPNSQLQGQEAA